MLVKFIIILGEEAQIKQSHMTLLFFQLPVVAPRVEAPHSSSSPVQRSTAFLLIPCAALSSDLSHEGHH